MARRIRSFDWTTTPLGPPAGWPADLRAVVGLMLDSPVAGIVLWGPDHIQLYNDRWRALLPEQACALGRPAQGRLAGIEADMAAAQARAMQGEALWIDAPPTPVAAAGRLHLAPIRGAAGQVLGLLGTLVEAPAAPRQDGPQRDAALHASEERHSFLLSLTDALRPLADTGAIRRMAMRLLSEHLGSDGATCFDVDTDEDGFTCTACHGRRPLPIPGHMRLSDFATDAPAACRAGQVMVHRDTEAEVALPARRAAYRALGLRAFIAAPLVRDGRLIGLVATHSAQPRDWSAAEIRLVADVAERSWAEVVRARAEAALHERTSRHAFLLRFSDRLRQGTDPARIARRALHMLLDELDLDLCYAAAIHPAEDRAEVIHQLHRPGCPPLPRVMRLSDFPDAFPGMLDQTLVFADMGNDPTLGEHDRRSADAAGCRSLVAVPLRRDGAPIWMLGAATAGVRHWTPGEIILIEHAAERLWSHLAQARAEAALHDSESRLRQFAEASSSVLWMRDADTLVLALKSPAFTTIYGRSCEGPDGHRLRCWLRMILPEDRPLVLNNLRLIRAGCQVDYEFRIRRADTGALRWIRNNDFPIRDGEGRVRWLGGLAMDVTDTKSAAERQKTLMAELQHRTRNLITVVRSLAERTLESTETLPDFSQRFGQRLAALSRVQGLLSHLAAGETASFVTLLEAEMLAHGIANGPSQKVVLTGPPGIALDADTVQVLALALHELATNAVKHGALSEHAPNGRLAITWQVSDSPGPRLHIDWRETGVPVAAPDPRPPSRGFGRRMIEQALPYHGYATTSFHLSPEGVHCVLNIALPG